MWNIASPDIVPIPSAMKNCIVNLNLVLLIIGKKTIPANARRLMMTTDAVPYPYSAKYSMHNMKQMDISINVEQKYSSVKRSCNAL